MTEEELEAFRELIQTINLEEYKFPTFTNNEVGDLVASNPYLGPQGIITKVRPTYVVIRNNEDIILDSRQLPNLYFYNITKILEDNEGDD